MNKITLQIRCWIVCLLFITLAVSCRKDDLLDVPNPNVRQCNSYVDQFEAIWQGIDHSYVLWARDTVDWDARYRKFRPVFESFDARRATNPVDSAEYHQAWKDLTKGLLDHHMALFLWNPDGKYKCKVTPASNNYHHTTDVEAQLNILQNQPGVTHFISSYDASNARVKSAFCLLPGRTAGKYIAYFRFSEFDLRSISPDSTFANKEFIVAPFKAFYGDNYTSGVTNGYAANEDVESIIIDVRANPGGNVSDLDALFGGLIQQDQQFGYTRYKAGMGRLDYSGWVPLVMYRAKNYLSKPKSIVVLSDINSASCAEIFTQSIKTLPNGTFIGERTFGATCALVPKTDIAFDIFYTGCFGDYNTAPFERNSRPTNPSSFSFYVYTATYDAVTNDYTSLEGSGVKPDIEVLYSTESLRSGVDNQLDAALKRLRNLQ